MELSNSIEILTEDKYEQVGNSRIGGCPDLPIGMNYPMSNDGFLEFILQINLGRDKIVGLPDEGLFSLFYGNLDKNDAIGFYTRIKTTLEKKEIPANQKFSGVTDYYPSIPHMISIKPKKIQPREELIEYNDSSFTDEENIWHWQTDFIRESSYFFGNGVEDKNSLYLKTNNFYLMAYGFGMRIDESNNKIIYRGQNANKQYKNLNDVLNCEKTTFYERTGVLQKHTREDWLEELHRFEKEKDEHLKRFRDFKCLLSLESSDKTKMVWGDYHKLEFYCFKSDIDKEDFSNIISTIC